jgi:hypothetical protein
MTAAILAVRPAARPGSVKPNTATTDLVRSLALDRLPVSRRPLICHWRLDAHGRLVCTWELDIGLVSHRCSKQTAKFIANGGHRCRRPNS